ncbi:MAG: hypothetical protein KA221_06225 [Vitreoscilla sp.]|nr:hypothetical protein [Vitreoscilla sp.]MBP9540670.1 hypothetical protein [Vitreoscilla sp.]
MKTFWSLGLILTSTWALAACSPTPTAEPAAVVASTPLPDEQAYKTQFDQNFQQSCYEGFQRSFTEQQVSANAEDLQAAQAVCACIAYNLIQNNSAAQLQSLEQMSASAAQEITQPLVNSCNEQVQTPNNTASLPKEASIASGN